MPDLPGSAMGTGQGTPARTGWCIESSYFAGLACETDRQLHAEGREGL